MLGPREVFAEMQRTWLEGGTMPAQLLAKDVLVETPFAAPGRPRRFAGREEFLTMAAAGRSALPVRFDECREIAVHDTVDPAVIIAEYELSGTVTTTNQRASAMFIGVLRVDNGRIALWREYQNTLAIAAAVGSLATETA